MGLLAMTARILILIAIIVYSASLPAQAGQAAIKKTMAKILPNVPIKSIKPSAIAGMFEVRIGTEVYYITSNGRFLIDGDIIDMRLQRNLTTIARAQIRLEMINAVSENKMIIYEPGKTKRTITVFTDIDCPYCRKFHKDVPTLVKGGIRIRYIVFPRDGLSTNTYRKSVSVWCSRDRKKALSIAKSGGKLAYKTCNNPIAEHYKLAGRVGITGTPTLVVDDGRIWPGYLPPNKLFSLLGIGQVNPVSGNAK